MSETNRLEYKRELNSDVDIEKEVIAFLNYHEGGFIFIGIDKLGNVIGVTDMDGDMLKIKDRIRNNVSPSAMGLFDVVSENRDGKELIKIIVASGSEKPYFKKKYGMTEKGCFLRTGTAATITSKERIDERFWNSIALREAVINAIVHNEFTREVPPKFEIFSDRIEITSTGSLPEGMTETEFFEGFSIPRNKELMRIYKDLELVEQLGSGIPRILEHYDRGCFRFTENFLRMVFPTVGLVATQVTMQVTTQVTTQVTEILKVFSGEQTRQELQDKLNLANREHFRKNYLKPALDDGLIELTLPDKPKSSKQKYRLTQEGLLAKNN